MLVWQKECMLRPCTGKQPTGTIFSSADHCTSCSAGLLWCQTINVYIKLGGTVGYLLEYLLQPWKHTNMYM